MHKNQKNHWALAAHFAGHIAVGFVLFLMIAAPAVALSLLVHVIEAWAVDGFTIAVLHFLAHAILIGDSVLFAVHMLVGIINFMKELWK